MPDFLKLQLYIGENKVYEFDGNPIPNPLPMSPDPHSASLTPQELSADRT